eukprot:TRINITY_DN2692_c0_g1_i1.p3 TRINITY_DN2692_c0_g1~~TRINITY_DN2692_c0_g1_i1.p3  ORF type:complete len:124 (-),score=28.90 TRINITY_DN2692_c0_g1_i1:1170-1541(-)
MKKAELPLVQSFRLANVVSRAISNGGFIPLPGDMKFFQYSEEEKRFVEYRSRLGKFLGIAYKSLHWSLLALWLYQVLNLAFAEVESNDFVTATSTEFPWFLHSWDCVDFWFQSIDKQKQFCVG